jgi:NarL family two-component system response regulator LiaR
VSRRGVVSEAESRAVEPNRVTVEDNFPEGPAMRAVRVALVNDYEIVLEGLAATLARYTDRVQVVRLTTESGVDADVDVILYDTFGRLPNGEKLHDVVGSTKAKVIVYTWSSYPVGTFLAEGAAACVHKGVAAKELVEVIVAVHEGRDAQRHDQDEAESWPGREHGLSARESEVLIFVADGLSNQEIAARMFLSINSVKTYIRTSYRKLGVTRRAQAVRWAIEHGLRPDVEPRGRA